MSVYCYLQSGTSGLRRIFLEHCSNRLNNSTSERRAGRRAWVTIIRDVYMTTPKLKSPLKYRSNSRHKKTDSLSVYCYLQSGTSGLRRIFLEYCSNRLNNSTSERRAGRRAWVTIIRDVYMTTPKVKSTLKHRSNSRHKKTDNLSVYCYLQSGTSGRTRTATPEETRF